MPQDPAYETYWMRKKLLAGSPPRFPVVRWWETPDLCEIERIFLDAVRESPSLLDVGAGDLRMMRKLVRGGYRGEYHTQDVGQEGEYTYRDLADIKRGYGAILCLDVIEHLPLRDGLNLVHQLISLLSPGGVLILQTGNALYVPEPRTWDMTHLHSYNVQDLWAFLTCAGLESSGYRVRFSPPRQGPIRALRQAIKAYIKLRILECDYANSIAVIARKRA